MNNTLNAWQREEALGHWKRKSALTVRLHEAHLRSYEENVTRHRMGNLLILWHCVRRMSTLIVVWNPILDVRTLCLDYVVDYLACKILSQIYGQMSNAFYIRRCKFVAVVVTCRLYVWLASFTYSLQRLACPVFAEAKI